MQQPLADRDAVVFICVPGLHRSLPSRSYGLGGLELSSEEPSGRVELETLWIRVSERLCSTHIICSSDPILIMGLWPHSNLSLPAAE